MFFRATKSGRFATVLVIILVLTLVLSGCGGGKTADSSKAADSGKSSSTQTQGSGSGGGKKWISIATASTAGAWYPIGGGMAAVISKYVTNMQANAETGAASLENLRNLQEGKVDIVFTQPDIAYQAYNGLDLYAGKKTDNLRSLMASYGTVAHFFGPKNSPYNSIKEFKGKKVGVGAPGSGTEVFNKTVLAENGLTYDDVEEQFLSVPDQVTAIKDGNLDLSMSLMPVPTGAFTELAVTNGMKLIPLEKDAIDRLVARLPGFLPHVIKAGSYPGQDKDIDTLVYRGLITTTTKMSEEDAYQITKAVWEHRDEWKDVHAVVKDMTLDTALLGHTVPLHPGAIKYYQEKGLTVPPELIPPEMKK
ncbi:hypothetical protein SY88_15680 [Clostridiales bacterium PH28_bin88]|nr:hypothetical protein SY88_15680 [Clostridiales bacterium PH28_bin88]